MTTKVKYEELVAYPQQKHMGKPVMLSAVLNRVFYQKDDFVILGLDCLFDSGIFSTELTAKGAVFAELVEGQTYQVKGILCEYKGEVQISIREFIPIKPHGKKATLAYLQTLDGIKGARASLLYDKFGDKAIDMILYEPEKVASIKGIGSKYASKWAEMMKDFSSERQATIQLLEFGLNGKQASQLLKKHGDIIVEKIRVNPYTLQQYVNGFSFAKTDGIALQMGQEVTAPGRIEAGIMHWLQTQTMFGHCYASAEELVVGVADVLVRSATSFGIRSASIADDVIIQGITSLAESGAIFVDSGRIYMRKIFQAEVEVSEHIQRLLPDNVDYTDEQIKAVLDEYLAETGFELEEKQYEACIRFNRSSGGIYVLNGSAGTGKTFTFNVLLEVARRLNPKSICEEAILAVAPTGKAAKVAKRAIKMDCVTIHRGLGYSGVDEGMTRFAYNNSERLPHAVIACDEASMVDIELMQSLISAIETGSKFILMGDTKQLPSVGAGNVLADLIESGVVPVVTLNVVRRQEHMSGTLLNATRVIQSEMVESSNNGDFYVINKASVREVQSLTVASMTRLLSKEKQCGISDIQVLVPMRVGPLGSNMLNYLLQKELNPGTTNVNLVLTRFDVDGAQYELCLKPGDKVIHTKNNYQMKLFCKDGSHYIPLDESTVTNGETGVVESVSIVDVPNSESGGMKKITRVIVAYDEFHAYYDDGVDELELAYAITIHKSQGSAWSHIILPMSTQHQYMLSNNLIYTAITRAESFAVMIGDTRAIWSGIQKTESKKRRTGLGMRLLGGAPSLA